MQLDLAGQAHSLANDAQGQARLLKLLRDHPTAQIVCEATGGYEQSVVRALHAAAVPVSVVEAGRVRHFARAKGQRAKTDPIDAAVLSEYGHAFAPAPTAAPTAQQTRLAVILHFKITRLFAPENHPLSGAVEVQVMLSSGSSAKRFG